MKFTGVIFRNKPLDFALKVLCLMLVSKVHCSKLHLRTLEYKFVLGGDQVIYARELPENKDLVSGELPKYVSRICLAIRSGKKEDVSEEIRAFTSALRKQQKDQKRHQGDRHIRKDHRPPYGSESGKDP